MTEQIFLSHPYRHACADVEDLLREELGATVYSNHTFLGGEDDPDKRADWRIAKICDSDVLVFFASIPGRPQLIRSIELGLAIGAKVPTVFIGEPRNSYHRYGEVFSDIARFVDAWRESKEARLHYTSLPRVS